MMALCDKRECWKNKGSLEGLISLSFNDKETGYVVSTVEEIDFEMLNDSLTDG